MFAANMLARRASCTLRVAAIPRVAARSLHATTPVLKKKPAVEIDSLFDDFEIVDEPLPKQPAATGQMATTKAAHGEASTSGRVSRPNKLSADNRKQKFSELIEFLKPRIGRKPAIKVRPRDSSWLQLLQFATTEAEVQEVVDLMPAWTAGGRVFTSTFSEKFVRRCEELQCPLLALQVYGNYAKYHLSLTLPAGRRLLHSLHRNYPIENLMTASALFGLYNIPAAAQDYVSCAIIVEACLRHNSSDSLNIANALLSHLRKLQADTKIDANDTYHRENVWVQKAMENIEKQLKNPTTPKPAGAVPPADNAAPELTA